MKGKRVTRLLKAQRALAFGRCDRRVLTVLDLLAWTAKSLDESRRAEAGHLRLKVEQGKSSAEIGEILFEVLQAKI